MQQRRPVPGSDRTRRTPRSARPQLEPLEDRCLLDAAGLAWVRQFNQKDVAYMAATLAGNASGVYSIYSTPGTPGYHSYTPGTLYLRKSGLDGTQLWTHAIDSTGEITPSAIAVGPDGIYVAGGFAHPVPNSSPLYGVLVRRYDLAGNLLWSHEYGTSGTAYGVAVAGGAVYVVGGNAHGFLGQPAVGGNDNNDAFLLKLDTQGTVTWVREFGIKDSTLAAAGVAVQGGAAYVLTQSSGPELTPDMSVVAVTRFAADGSRTWATSVMQAGWIGDLSFHDAPEIHSLVAGPDGVYTAVNYLQLQPPLAAASGPRVVHLDLAGHVTWVRAFVPDRFYGIASAGDGVYVYGSTPGLPNAAGAGKRDGFVRKLDPVGNGQGYVQFGTPADDKATALTTAGGQVYVVGMLNETLPDESGYGDPLIAQVAPVSPDATWVQSLYGNLLGRPGDVAGVANWVTALGRGTSRQAVVAAFTASREYAVHVVNAVFTEYLHRSADAGGLAAGLGYLASPGGTEEGLRAQVLASPEYYQRNGGTAAGVVQALYKDVLLRAGDAAGVAAWTSALQHGTPVLSLARALINSTERHTWLTLVVFQNLLGRQPDPTGLAGWVHALDTGTTPLTFFNATLVSPEYVAHTR